MAAALPGFLVLDRHPVLLESLPPAVEVFRGDAQGEMTRSRARRVRGDVTPKGASTRKTRSMERSPT